LASAPSDNQRMPACNRREFLQSSIATAIAGLTARSAAQSNDPFAGGVMVGTRPLSGRGAADTPIGTLLGRGLDARLFTDLSTLTPDTLITSNDRFYVRTSAPDRLDASRPWTVTLGGLVRRPVTVTLDRLAQEAVPMGTHLLECAGNNNPGNFGLMSAAEWSGVPIASVLKRVQPAARGGRILVSGFDGHSLPSRSSTPGASWIFSVDDLERAGAFLATGMNAAPLPKDHGFPVRLMVPRWYGCACIKWVTAIDVVADDAPATSQMKEFAARTFQKGQPERAREYTPASIDHAAMPIRVEQWAVNGRVLYRVVGILWGGEQATDALAIRFRSDEPYVRVQSCPKPASTTTWSLWWHAWRPPSRGRYDIVLKIDDPRIRTTRLDVYFYSRSVDIAEA
jgi:DMSO/TMAO reductase YedYZ molybdopterin-dependent catalytic subunit